ncbi:Phospholipid-transporting ATPase [Gryllus bimaculatus]|nr:Phospholipid-transporting ATPase [Gryllus bimaculatus]
MATEVVAAAAAAATANTAPSAQSLRARKLEENGAAPAAAAVPVRRFSVGLSAPLGSENLLLRGTRLRNTDYVYGCAVYTGQQTKLALNWRLTSNKFSTIEKTVNKFLLFFLLLLMTETGASLGLKYAIELSFASQMKWYLGDVFTVSSLTVINDLFSFVILYNYIIPISLYVTIEMQKFLGTLFFEWDALLYDPNTELSAVCNSSDLNEELGQVEVLFTDKTGTLTENDMQFRRCSVGGVVYAEQDGVLTRLGADMDVTRGQPLAALSGELEEFFVALALCHTVQMDAAPPNNNAPAADCLTYQASSPDEKALTEAAARVGVVFLGEEGDFASVQVKGEVRRYRKLDVLEFSSDRKRMSVVVEDEAGNVVLLCKGAETAVLPLADAGPTHETQAHVNDFAMRGLRVMMVGSRLLERAELHALEQQVEVARQTVSQQRAQLVAAAYARMEAGLRLLGATAVEDRLQDGVQETLESLRAAGVAVWILTGDKEETAVNISYSCGHFKNGTEQLYLTKHKNFDNCVASLERYR